MILKLIIGVILICVVAGGYKSYSLYKSKTQLEREVYDLKSTVEAQNKKIVRQLNINKKLEEELAINNEENEQQVDIYKEHKKLNEQNIKLMEMIKQSEYLKTALRINEYSKNRVEFFPLYHATIEVIGEYNEEEKIDGYILVDKTLSIKEKMQLIANNVSRSYFGLPIEVEKIEERDGKKFAIINLVEYTENEWDEWSTKFQGSLQEMFTMSTLERNFIQTQYSGEWVDGIEIQQNHGYRRAGHIGAIPWIVSKDDIPQKYELKDFLESDGEKQILEIIDGKIISRDGQILIQGPVESGNQWIVDNRLTIITRVGFTYYDGNIHSGTTIETLTLDLTDGTILKRYIGKGKGLVKEEILYPVS